MRGPNIFKEYWGNPEATAETMAGGWLRTGDLGELDDEGYLKITGRKKDIIITAGGKNLTPANIENDLKQSRFISQAVMYGDRQPYPVALITLDPEEIVPWAQEQGLPEDLAELAEHRRGGDDPKELDRANSNYARVEQIKRFAILDHDLSIETGELTPSLKVKRNVIYERYGDVFESLYFRERTRRLRSRADLRGGSRPGSGVGAGGTGSGPRDARASATAGPAPVAARSDRTRRSRSSSVQRPNDPSRCLRPICVGLTRRAPSVTAGRVRVAPTDEAARPRQRGDNGGRRCARRPDVDPPDSEVMVVAPAVQEHALNSGCPTRTRRSPRPTRSAARPSTARRRRASRPAATPAKATRCSRSRTR